MKKLQLDEIVIMWDKASKFNLPGLQAKGTVKVLTFYTFLADLILEMLHVSMPYVL